MLLGLFNKNLILIFARQAATWSSVNTFSKFYWLDVSATSDSNIGCKGPQTAIWVVDNPQFSLFFSLLGLLAFVCTIAHSSIWLLFEVPKVKDFLYPSVYKKENRIFVFAHEMLFFESVEGHRFHPSVFMIMIMVLLCYKTESCW